MMSINFIIFYSVGKYKISSQKNPAPNSVQGYQNRTYFK